MAFTNSWKDFASLADNTQFPVFDGAARGFHMSPSGEVGLDRDTELDFDAHGSQSMPLLFQRHSAGKP